jgi:hypothetical protein
MKCSSNQEMLCLVKMATYQPLRLNREIINLLDSFACGTIREAICALNTSALDEIAKILINRTRAEMALRRHFDPKHIDELARAGVDILSEPFWKSVLLELYNFETRLLRSKSHIPVPKGCHLMGAPDHLGLLKHNEVFLRIPTKRVPAAADFTTRATLEAETQAEELELGRTYVADEDYTVITGPVLIFRNPCLDPGDVQVVQAVNVPQLYGWKNVILFPCNDRLTGPSIPAQCSGGDLDGDCFSIIWDERFIPPPDRLVAAVRYDLICSERAQDREVPKSEEEFLVRSMANSSLGRIAHMHLALCDKFDDGAKHPLARELAKQQSFAVDFPKNGIPPAIPAECHKLIRTQGFPDFMEKTSKPSYVSHKVLGVTYRECSDLSCEIHLLSESSSFMPDSCFTVHGYELYLAQARKDFNAYKTSIQQNLIAYDVTSETELMFGIQPSSRDFSFIESSTSMSMKESWRLLQAQFRKIFDAGLNNAGREEKLKKASAWYNCAYEDRKYLSFAWVALSCLCEARAQSMSALPDVSSDNIVEEDDHLPGHVISEEVGRGALQQWKNDLYYLQRAVQKKTAVFSKISRALVRDPCCSHVELFGSVSLLQCHEGSDCDICVFNNLQALDDGRAYLDTVVRPLLTEEAILIRQLDAQDIPLLRLEVEDGRDLHSIDVTTKIDGVLKSRLLRKIFSSNCVYLPMFTCLRSWAQSCGMLGGRDVDKKSAELNSGQFQALFVEHVLQQSDVSVSDLVEPVVDDELFRRSGEVEDAALGRELWRFFLTGMRPRIVPNNDDTWTFEWPVSSIWNQIQPEAPHYPITHIFTDKNLKHFTDRCRQAVHFLGVSRSYQFLIERSRQYVVSVTTLEVELSRAVSESIGEASSYHAMRLMHKTKAVVEIKPKTDINGTESQHLQYVVYARGTIAQLQLLRKELREIIYFNRAFCFGAIVRSSLHASLMKNCTFLFPRLCTTPAANLELVPYHGEYNYKHAMKSLHRLKLRSRENTEDWRIAFVSQFTEKITDQLQQVSKVEGREELVQFDCNLGVFYLIDAEDVFDRSRGAYSCKEIESSIQRMRADLTEKQISMESSCSVSKALANKSSSTNSNSSTRNSSTASRSEPRDDHSVPTARKRANKKKSFIASSLFTSILRGHNNLSDAEIERRLTDILCKLGFVRYDQAIHAADSTCCMRCGTVSSLPVNDGAAVGTTDSNDSGTAYFGKLCHVVRGTSIVLPDHCWKIHCAITPTQQAEITCSEDLTRFEYCSNRFYWVHGTLLNQRNKQTTTSPVNSSHADEHLAEYSFADHDLRFKMSSSNDFSPEEKEKIIETYFPGHKAPIDIKDSKPRIRDEVIPKQDLYFLRHTYRRVVFLNPDTLRYYHYHKDPSVRSLLCPDCRGLLEATEATSGKVNEFEGLNDYEYMSKLLALPKYAVNLIFSTHYEGDLFAHISQAVDLSMTMDTTGISQFINGEIDALLFSKLIHRTIDDIVTVSEEIRLHWN